MFTLHIRLYRKDLWATSFIDALNSGQSLVLRAYSLLLFHRKNGCFGSSGGSFPRVVPKLCRDLFLFRALWSTAGFA